MAFHNAVHEAYDGMKTCTYRNYGHKCWLCGAKLGTTYLEERLYAIRCEYCQTITLIEARSAFEAENAIGVRIDGV